MVSTHIIGDRRIESGPCWRGKREPAVHERENRKEWVATNKALRASIKSDLQQRHTQQIRDAIERGSGLRVFQKQQTAGKHRIHALKNNQGQVVHSQGKLEEVIQQYYNTLYKGDQGAGFQP